MVVAVPPRDLGGSVFPVGTHFSGPDAFLTVFRLGLPQRASQIFASVSSRYGVETRTIGDFFSSSTSELRDDRRQQEENDRPEMSPKSGSLFRDVRLGNEGTHSRRRSHKAEDCCL